MPPKERVASASCGVCDSATRPLVCPGCLGSSFLDERRKRLQGLQARKEEVEATLTSLLQAKVRGAACAPRDWPAGLRSGQSASRADGVPDACS